MKPNGKFLFFFFLNFLDWEVKKSAATNANKYKQTKSQQKPALSTKDQENFSLARQKMFLK